jgi:hypothetical protein
MLKRIGLLFFSIVIYAHLLSAQEIQARFTVFVEQDQY